MSLPEEAAQSNTITKKCPNCRNLGKKKEDGDHATCTVCKTNFCFLCLFDLGKNAEIDEIARHMAREHGGFNMKLEEEEEEYTRSENEAPHFQKQNFN